MIASIVIILMMIWKKFFQMLLHVQFKVAIKT